MTKKKKKSKPLSGEIKFVIAIALICAIFLGLILYSKYNVREDQNLNDYNSFTFQYDYHNNFWVTTIEMDGVPYVIPFYFHPTEVEDVVVEDDIENIILFNRPSNIIIALPGDSGSEMAIAGIEIAKITGERFKVLKIPTTTAVNDPVEGLPYATCADADEETVVISFEHSSRNLVHSEGRCIILEFKDNESVRVADAFVYNLLKIM